MVSYRLAERSSNYAVLVLVLVLVIIFCYGNEEGNDNAVTACTVCTINYALEPRNL
ncbi:MAG: hypothetical protein LBC74_12050 [Planctomycetaceae bacterium]|nr:hypothetical protein [Planctomycetaceae bacterium]